MKQPTLDDPGEGQAWLSRLPRVYPSGTGGQAVIAGSRVKTWTGMLQNKPHIADSAPNEKNKALVYAGRCVFPVAEVSHLASQTTTARSVGPLLPDLQSLFRGRSLGPRAAIMSRSDPPTTSIKVELLISH